ncbi:MAG: GTPase Era [Proteobacteria bacterium]|nr:GTPase Era [Pseudomonadota bacterium]
MSFKSGYVAIVGAPNAGKSTLLNRLLGEKLSITSRKPQTTRNRILGVVHRPSAQLIFLDTPGVHKSTAALNERMVEVAFSVMGDVDLVLVLVDVSSPDPASEEFLVKKLENLNKKVVLGLNKIDCVSKPELLGIINTWSKVYSFEGIVPISAKHGDQVDVLLGLIEDHLPEGPPLFPEDTMTDLPERFFVAEMVREKVFRLTGQEIPYSAAVTVDSFSHDKGLTRINATIHVERDSQKGIVIGKAGSKLKQIGEDSRKEIEKMLGRKVFLKLFVRVQKNWSRDTKAITKFGV